MTTETGTGTTETGTDREGRIVTFYSYKGGTGRTMALVNVGWILASNGLRVLLVDWDLEAPGLHRYLRPLFVDSELRHSNGLMNMVTSYVGQVMGSGEPAPSADGPAAAGDTVIESEEWLRSCARLRPYTTGLDLTLPPGGRLDFLPAGRQSASYSAAVTTFDWHRFYDRLGGGSFLQVLREEMKAEYDYVLIDSRTGVSDTSGICTMLLPDMLVNGFALNLQSIGGCAEVAASVAESAPHPVRILPVPMRVEDAEQALLQQGRDSARAAFVSCLSWLAEDEHDRYWGEVEIPYKTYYAYAEIPATVGDRPLQAGSLLAAFERLTAWITDGRVRALQPQPAEERRLLNAEYRRDPRAVPSRFYISYAPADRMWAEWAAGHLEAAGYRVSLHSTGVPATGTPPEAESVLERRGRVLALLSPDYVRQPRATDVWNRVLGGESAGVPALVAVRVHEMDASVGGVFAERLGPDLTRRAPEDAARRLLEAVGSASTPRGADGAATAAGSVPPPFPTASPAVWRVPSRNVSFTGRGLLLEELRDRFTTGTAAVPLVLYGLGGMGKTQIAQEYAHRFRAAYDVICWVPAAQPHLIRPALAALAPQLGLDDGEDTAGTAEAVLRALRAGRPYGRWLLLLDNAGRPEKLEEFLPEGPPGGHVLVTSRDRTWVNRGELVEVDVFQRRESLELLQRLNPQLSASETEQVAESLGDLPLAISQAAVWLSDGSMPVVTYLELLKDRLTEVLGDTQLPQRDYPHSAAATWRLALDELRRVNPAAAEMLEICAFFGPDPIPMRLLYGRAVTQMLTLDRGESRDEMAIAQLLRAINRFGLARSDQSSETLTVHRLVQAVIRDQVDEERRLSLREVVHKALVGAAPGEPDLPTQWGRYAELLPHLRPSRAVKDPDPEVRSWIIDSVRYLYRRSLFDECQDLAEYALDGWRTAGFGDPDDPHVLRLSIQLGNVLRSRGQLIRAYEVDVDTFERFRRRAGAVYVHTLAAAGNLAADLRALGRYGEARDLDRQTFESARRELGEDHPRTMMYLNNLATSEYLAGNRAEALRLDKEAYDQQREMSGEQSMYTLMRANNYARDLRENGRLEEGLELVENTVRLSAQVLGEQHTRTLLARKNLAVALRRSGRYQLAKEMDEDLHNRYVAAHGPEHADTLAAACNLAADLAALGNTARAVDLAERAMSRYETYLGPEHPVSLACANNLSVYLRLEGHTERAREMSGRVWERMAGVLGEKHPYTLCCMVNHANDLALAGARDGALLAEAVELDSRAREFFVEVLGVDHYDTIGVTANLALGLRAVGRVEEADVLAEEALRRARETLGEDHPTTRAVLAGSRLDADIEPPTT
ncbi:FxSxx-COOH system tetratricopeptide repeat protein [Streptomyces griseoaurantiacus]|uniref:FxSxx-COOH system tetratricopeptide repeat protein n=1 Tax=Streptomyces griseoaurantiacus TaxID=68213 RepID=UPI00352D4676